MMNKENIFKQFKVGYKGDYSLGADGKGRQELLVIEISRSAGVSEAGCSGGLIVKKLERF